MRFEPADFYRRALPLCATDKGTQLARKRQLDRKRAEELALARELGFEQGYQKAEAVILDIKGRFEQMWKELVKTKEVLNKEREEGAAFRRKVDSEKRQKTLQHFFKNPLSHEARPRGEPVKLGEGYTERNLSSGCFAQHVKAVELHIISLAKDDPLKQLQLAAAISQRMQGIRHLRDRDQEAWSYMRNSLKAFFEKLQDKYSGRYPNHIRAAQQAVCAAISNSVPPRKLHVIQEAVGVSTARLAEGRRHWSDWVSGDRECIMDLRGKARSDSMPEEWIAFAIDIWKDNTRRSERAKDSIRNPNDKSDKKLYRVHWLEVRIADIHALILREGKRKFNQPALEGVPATESSPAVMDPVEAVEFHFSWWYTKKVRPFFVKDGGREVCVCVYHLRWELFVEALYNYLKRLRCDLKACSCEFTNYKSPVDFRRAHTCTRVSSERYDEVGCVHNKCASCKDLSLFQPCLCQPRSELPPIKCQLWKQMDYTLKDGTVKQKKDFVPVQVPFSEFEDELRKYWAKFMLHHDVGKWQDDETVHLKSHVDRGSTFEIQDFGENYHIERKREHQTFYFCEIGVTLYGCMLRIRVEDLHDEYLGEGEKQKLLNYFRELGKPPIILIAHVIISDDLSHDNAFVQHVNSRIIWEWLQKVVAPGVTIQQRIICTDGAPSQYKLADQILWVSKQGAPGSGTPKVRHIFRGTAHGKDDSDPELGHHKNAADRWQLRAEEGEVAKIFTPHDFYEFASREMRVLNKDFYSRNGKGIYRREFHWVPNRGPNSVNRRTHGCNRIGDVGIKKLHFFDGIGQPGFVGIRELSCHKCIGACSIGRFQDCKNSQRCGSYRILELSPKTAAARLSTRTYRENGALEFAESATPGSFFVTDATLDPMEKFTVFRVSKDSLFRQAESSIVASETTLAVQRDEDVIDGDRFTCVSAGGTVFASTHVEMTVPVKAILAFNLDLQMLEARRVFRTSVGNLEKWQMSSDDHARVLRLLSDTLDDVVANAVANVSGRS